MTLYDLEIYMIDRVWFMINFGEGHFPLAPPMLEIWIFEILKIRTLKSNNSRSIIVRIFWFAYYCSSDVSEQESIKKSGGVWWTLTHKHILHVFDWPIHEPSFPNHQQYRGFDVEANHWIFWWSLPVVGSTKLYEVIIPLIRLS